MSCSAMSTTSFRACSRPVRLEPARQGVADGASEVNWVIHEGKLKKGCLVRLKSYSANQVKDKRILIVLDLEVWEDLGESDKIGEPQAIEVKAEVEAKAQPTTISTNGF